MFTPAISPADPNLMMLNCDMSAAYISEDGGRNWRMIHHAQLRSDTPLPARLSPNRSEHHLRLVRRTARVSRDRGRTFAPIGNLKDSLWAARSPSIRPIPRLMLAGTRNGRCWLVARRGRDVGGAAPGRRAG